MNSLSIIRMASYNTPQTYFQLTIVLYFLTFSANFCSCTSVKSFNHSLAGFQEGIATWFGAPNGAGIDGGACGYENLASENPYNSFIFAGNPALFKNGNGCGACYQVKCTKNPSCSGFPVTVTISDSCPGCTNSPFHIDLSAIAFGALAKSGQGNQLRNAGSINILFQRVPCQYPGSSIVFHVDRGSNDFFFAFVILNVNGDGDFAAVELKPAGSSSYLPLQINPGTGTYRINAGQKLRGPFSIRLTSGESKRTKEAVNVIPFNWEAGKFYQSNINF